MEDEVQDGIASPGQGKSKLDTLPKEDLIKFAKKQMVILQKLKSKCKELEKEIEELKAKPNHEVNDAVVQELTDRLDGILLEKAEIQHSLVSLRKEHEKTKQDTKDAVAKATELQKQLEQSNANYLKEVEDLRKELEAAYSKHKEDLTKFEKELQESSEKQRLLNIQLEEQFTKDVEIKGLHEELKQIKVMYEDHVLQLKEQLKVNEKMEGEIKRVQEGKEDALGHYQNEVKSLHEECEKMKADHQKEVSELMHQLEMAASKLKEEKTMFQEHLQDLTAQHTLNEKNLRDELNNAKGSYEEELGQIKKKLNKTGEREKEASTQVQEQACLDQNKDKRVKYLEATLQEITSKHCILKDEITYMNNVKMKLEMELQQMKDEFFHEREELEFKINELQLSKEEYVSVVSKLKSDLQTVNDHCEMILKQHTQELQVLKEGHEREVVALKQILASSYEKENTEIIFEVQELKNQCQQALQEKEAAVSSYENLRETLETLQTELGESAGKISQEFEAMKRQQAFEIDELQQKLRAAFSEKDALLETINQLQTEAQRSVNVQNEVDELRDTTENLQEKNLGLLASLSQKDVELNELQGKLMALSSEKDNAIAKMSNYEKEIGQLKELYVWEQTNSAELQKRIEELDREHSELKQKQEVLEDKLGGAGTENDQSSQKLQELENRLALSLSEREQLMSEVKALREDLSQIEKEKQNVEENLEFLKSNGENFGRVKQHAEDLENKMISLSEERDRLLQTAETKQQELNDFKAQVSSILEEEGSRSSTEDKEQEPDDLLQVVKRSLRKLREEKQCIELQSDEQILQLKEELERLREENANQLAECRCLIVDLQKERDLLKEHLEGALSDKDGLQRDLLEMKLMNEKASGENQDLLAQIADATKQLELMAKEKEDQTERGEKCVAEMEVQDHLQDLLKQREAELEDLKAELTSLKCEPVEEPFLKMEIAWLYILFSPKEDLTKLESTSNNREDKFNKIKAVAVKAKKELDASRKEVQSFIEELAEVKSERDRLSSSMKDLIPGAEGYKNLLLEYEKQAEQLDTEKERAVTSEREVKELTRQLQAAVQQKEQLTSDQENLQAHIETLQSNVKQLEAQILETQKAKMAVEKELEGEKLLKEQKIKEHNAAQKEVEELQKQLQKEKKQLQQVLQELELVRKDAQKSTLMDMEIADYERLVKELNQKITDQNSRISELEGEIDIQKQKQESLQVQISSFQSSLDQSEEMGTKIKQLLVKTKKELADSKKVEAEQLVLQASLKGELEASQQQSEEYKIQLADLTAEKHKLQNQMRVSTEQHQRLVSSFQQRLAALEEACSTAKTEQAATASEFESYKVRVHNVLKQQKNKSASQLENEAAKQERENLQMMIDQLKTKLQDTQSNLQVTVTELQALQSEHDTLLERHNKMLQETVVKEAELREKLCTVQSENVVLKAEHAQSVNQLISQNEALRNNYRDQVRHLQEEHRTTVETLQQQLVKMEAQLVQLQSESSTTGSATTSQGGKVLRERRNMDLPLFDMHSMAREEGEGMETTDTESVSSASTPVPSFEQLLNSPESKSEPPQWQPELTKDELVQKLNTATKSIDHLNSLLHETEATNAVLMEQITLLKSEVRRLERNQEREKSVANLEYLKNVVLQFIFLKAGSERQRLLPVIHTMLQLSPEEKGKLAAIAQGEDEGASRSSGWASYLHSWSGLR
ncbi:GRIP and coiled-coil domain-containing protein 2 [Latimeria chalumnae]|uniref:GRIP and coiled-coil domain-containing protein 2 n=1 Tax=Latimeria chalumnae TaxID=7897 RepID=UPI00313DC501